MKVNRYQISSIDDTNQSYSDTNSSFIATNSSQILAPELSDLFTPVNSARSLTNQQSLSQMMPSSAHNTMGVQWANVDSPETSEPRKINRQQHGTFNQNGAGIQRKTIGKIPANIEPLSLDVDPHAWDLRPEDLDFHKLIQNFCK